LTINNVKILSYIINAMIGSNYCMLSPDNYVQSPNSSQSFNRYSYCWNNPLKYTDPSGEKIFTLATLIAAPFTSGASLTFLPAAIGADIGMWQGGTMANGNMNPTKWDYSSGKTWGYMAAGGAVGAASGYTANAVATSGTAGAKTASLVVGSTTNSIGTALYNGGQTSVSISFGIGSFNMETGKLRGIWNWNDLSTGEKIGYGLGAFTNLVDAFGIINPADANYQLRTDNTQINKIDAGHSSIIKDGKTVISFGPNSHNRFKSILGTKSTNSYPDLIYERPDLNISLNNKAVDWLAKQLPKVPYSAGSGLHCSGAASMAGLLSGKYMINMALLTFNIPQLTYFTYKYEQLIMMSSVLTTIHTTK
jgi:hypothetical protein